MSKTRVFVEIRDDKVVRIFKSHTALVTSEAFKNGSYREWPRKDAVESIRRQVYERSGGQCEFCPNAINWNFHMHEKVPRGSGGEISLENSVALCAECHIGRDGEHANRYPQFGLSQDEEMRTRG